MRERDERKKEKKKERYEVYRETGNEGRMREMEGVRNDKRQDGMSSE